MLVHLNHRLVQLSLRLPRVEVWSTHGRKKLQAMLYEYAVLVMF